jgi:CheY-like chemotaxis protein
MLPDRTVILCVDDEETPLLLRRLVLQKAGYEVITATSAAQALQIVASSGIDLVLSDHLMPCVTGTELARQVKASAPALPVILLSGVNDVPADADCADLFLSKLVGPVSLCESISRVLSKREQLSRTE